MTPRIWINQAHASQRDVAALIRSGLESSVEVLASHGNFREDIFMAADGAFLEPAFEGQDGGAYRDWALAEAAARGVSGIIAMRHRRTLAGARDAFAAAGIRVAAGAVDPATIELCDHKDRFTEAMAGLGIPVAKTIAVRTAAELRAAIATIEIDGEACVKPAVGVYGRGYWRFQRNRSLFDIFDGSSHHAVDPENFIQAFEAADEAATLIVMEHLPGVEHSVDCVCDAGRLVAHATRRKTANYQLVSTGGIEAEIAAAIVGHLALDGIVNVQTRVDRHGATKVLEVNTRPSGGIGYSAAAGLNLPADAARVLLGRKVVGGSLPDPVAVRIVDQPVRLPLTTARLAKAGAA